jgi:hypothetical protein
VSYRNSRFKSDSLEVEFASYFQFAIEKKISTIAIVDVALRRIVEASYLTLNLVESHERFKYFVMTCFIDAAHFFVRNPL